MMGDQKGLGPTFKSLLVDPKSFLPRSCQFTRFHLLYLLTVSDFENSLW